MSSRTTGVDTRVVDHVLVIEMRRHDKRNAVDRHLADALDAALNRLDDDKALRAGVLTGGSFFSAGSDLRSGGDYVTTRGGEYGLIRRLRQKPLIAAVEGAALGGGLEMVLACDLVVVASNARLGLPEVVRGVVPSCGGLFRALLALPASAARELVLTGAAISGERAHALGLANAVTEPGGTLAAALALAQRIACNSPAAVRASLTALNAIDAFLASPGWAATEQAMRAVRGHADQEEGIQAFFEQREPRWTT